MKDLKEYIRESILDDVDDQIDRVDEIIKRKIQKFIKEHYMIYANNSFSVYTISNKPNKDGKYEVSSKWYIYFNTFNKTSKKLTNDLFVWKTVKGTFDCNNSIIDSLEGAPKQVGGDFLCNWTNITSLKGAL